MDGLVGKDTENIFSAASRSDVKFFDPTVEFQRLHGMIGEDDAVPTDTATGVAFRDDVIRSWIERHEPKSQLTIFICGNCCRDVCAGR